MDSVTLKHQKRFSFEADDSEMRIVVLYSDQCAANKMTEVYGRLVQQLRGICRAKGTWWSMDLLQREELFETSLRAATQADLLFLAVEAQSGLSARIRSWLEAALRDAPKRECAVAALLGSNGEPASWHSETHEFLNQLASSHGIEYFALWHLIAPTKESLLKAVQRADSGAAIVHLTRLIDKIENGSHWGINE